uniref:DDE Tnp4 domain-containing protein n=1 Tax=Solanum lycopersicum TaxID=4081 RepID=A0A3Q7FPE8_SOLLC
MFLNILAHHEKNRSIKVDYIRSGWSVSHAFNECLSAILKLTPLLFVNPKPVLEDEIKDRWKWFEVGSAADDRVLRDAIVRTNGLKIHEGNYYLCDGGYTNGKRFFSPYREVDPLDVDIEEQMEYQHENINVIESSEEWTTWRDELAQSMRNE